MPVGLADTLTRGELVDLVRFLSELGKVGPYADQQGTAWCAAGRRSLPTPEAAALLDAGLPDEAAGR